MRRKRFFVYLGLLALMNSMVLGQGESALPFLLITSSPAGNGMGGIISSTLTDNAMAPIANPGQLGLMSMNNYFSFSSYTPKTAWLPQFHLSDLTYSTTAFNVGVNFQNILPIPFPVSMGFGYSDIYLNLGEFNVTGPNGPGVIATFNAYERSVNHTIGVGLDYFLRAGIGFTAKLVESNLANFDIQRQWRAESTTVSTSDVGILVQAPMFSIVSKLRDQPVTLFPKTEPIFDITFGYARKNLGNKSVIYLDSAQGDPLPRTAALGLSWKIGLTSHGNSGPWEIISYTLAREAEDLLVQRFPAPTDSLGNVIGNPPPWRYQDGTGDIQFFDNVFWGKWNGQVWLRKGWQFQLGEFLYIRGGSVTAPGLVYSTDGFGIHSSGVVRLVETLSGAPVSSGVFGFFAKHIELQFDHASESSAGPRGGTTYDGLNVILR